VRYALERLPWVEEGSVEADIRRQRVRFAVKDKKAFDLEQVRQVIGKAGFQVGDVLAGP
jgi:hypothetical protein